MSRFFSKIAGRRRLWVVGLLLFILLVTMPSTTSAQTADGGIVDKVQQAIGSLFSLGEIQQSVISFVVFGLTWMISLIAGLFIGIESWFLEIIININFNLVNSAPVKIGFPIVLGMANLFFVGALIVIAIATILRRAEYGAKKVLWKLVVMAVMVNFGLVICGSLLSISDEATKFFIQSATPGSGNDESIWKFSESIAGAFNPPASFLSLDSLAENPDRAAEDLGFASKAGDALGNMIKPIVGVLSTLGSLTIIVITLATLNAMLLWRYIRLGMALILLPLAWAAWIFPTYQEHYKKWWTKFTQWTIFPPVVIFFIWLGLKTSQVMSNTEGEYARIWRSTRGDGYPNPISDYFGALLTPIISQTLKTFILFGIMMGGIVAAQELGIKFADAGYKAAESAGGWAKAKAGRVAGARIRNVGKRYNPNTKETSTALQRFGSRLQAVPVLKKVPGFQAIGQYVAGQGNTKKRYDENIEKERKGLEGLTNEGLLDAARVTSIDPSVQAAKAQELARRNMLDPSKIGGGNVGDGNKILEGLVRSAEKMGNEQSLYNVRPELVKYSKKVAESNMELKDAIADVVKKIPAGEANRMSHESMGSQNPLAEVGHEIAATFLNMSNGQFAKIGAEGNFEQQQAIFNTFEQLKKTRSIGGKEMDSRELDQLDRIEKHLNNNANWSRATRKEEKTGGESSGGTQKPPNPNH